MANPGSGSAPVWQRLVGGKILPIAIWIAFACQTLANTKPWLAGLEDPVRRNSYLGLYVLDLINALLTVAYLGILVILYLVRPPRRSGFGGLFVSMVVFFATFSLVIAAYLPHSQPRVALYLPAISLATLGIAYTVWTLIWLGKSFSLLPEARQLVTGGPYAMSRHPLYLGETLASVSLLAPRATWVGWVVIIAYVFAQLTRIRWEEQILELEFGARYRAYQLGVAKYLPRLWGIRKQRDQYKR